ncbi:hypothetical protein WJX75_001682 [Coccomyxa subellipsoidea]|uniref:Uncharacterized protein n=1 Tax=Coccomyxa subellipsoidea TaxID=248742 RepID=A0ABR2YVF0_9CHLO
MASRRKAKVSRLEQVLARGELVRAEAEAPGSPRGSFSLPGSPNTSLTTTGPSPSPSIRKADGFTSAFEADIASVAHKVDASSKGGVREGIEQGNKSPTSTVSSAAVGSSVGSLLQEMEKLMIEILEDSLWASEGLHAAEDAEFEEEIKGLTAEELLVKIVNMSMEAEKDCIELAKMTDAMNKVLKGYDDVGT